MMLRRVLTLAKEGVAAIRQRGNAGPIGAGGGDADIGVAGTAIVTFVTVAMLEKANCVSIAVAMEK